MRVLLTFAGGWGHLEPLLPIAGALAAAGHTTAFACPPALTRAIHRAGFTTLELELPPRPTPERLPLRPLDREREERDLRENFARRLAQERAPRLEDLLRDWRPDLLVCDETDFGAMVAAERSDLPHVGVSVIASGAFVRPEIVGGALAELRQLFSLPPDPELAMLRRHLVLAPAPPSFRHPEHPLPATGRFIQPPMPRGEPGEAPWPTVRAGAPVVYFSLGTVFAREAGDLLARGVAGLRELPIELVVTTGDASLAAELGPQPDHVHVSVFLAQGQVLPHCAAAISHAGSGSVIGALAHGLPGIAIPLGADQPQNADRCRALGCATVLDALTLSPESLAQATHELLGDPERRRSAEALRDELAALPGPATAVGWMEELLRS